jgi:molybdate transport system ATP-binding protein
VELRELLRHFLGDIVMVTHSRDEVYKLCDGLLVMEAGQSLIQGDTKEIFQNPGILPAARLTGCKNLSRARRVNEQEVEALDWGFRFRIPAGAHAQIDYIGIRAHDFEPVYSEDETVENRIPIRVIERMEGPFEWNMVCVNAHVENPEIQHRIWWMCGKGTLLRAESPPYLTVRPQCILLLRTHG